MCGICAIISKEEIKKPQFKDFRKLLEETEQRGKDATGYIFYKDGKRKVVKTNKKASLFVKKMKYKQIGGSLLIGHCRQTTSGDAKINDNNHPIISQNFAVVHNGIIRNDDSLFKEFKLNRVGEVDSEIIVALIEHFFNQSKNVEDAIRKTVKQLRGDYACILSSQLFPGKVWTFRNGRPLEYLERNNDIVITSTFPIMRNACHTKGISITSKEDYIYEFTNEGVKQIEGKLEVAKPSCSNFHYFPGFGYEKYSQYYWERKYDNSYKKYGNRPNEKYKGLSGVLTFAFGYTYVNGVFS